MRKILVLRGGALGDFLVTLPALALLRQRWPEARIELAGNARAAELARTRGLLDAVHSQHEARWSALFGTEPLPESFAAWLGSFDLVVNYWPDPDRELRRRFPLRAGQQALHGDATPRQAPAAAHYCDTLRPLGLETREYIHRLFPLRETPLVAGDVVAIHPGSGSPRKNWPAERWREVIARLCSPVLLILGEAEHAAWPETVRATLPGSVEIAASPPLEALIARLACCRLFLGHDSGISHLAAACDAPAVLLFGPTEPALWAPPSPTVRVLRRGPAVDAIPVAEVLAAALGDRR